MSNRFQRFHKWLDDDDSTASWGEFFPPKAKAKAKAKAKFKFMATKRARVKALKQAPAVVMYALILGAYYHPLQYALRSYIVLIFNR